MSKSPILAQAPGVQVPVGRDGSTVGTTTGDISDALRPQGFDQSRFVTVPGEHATDGTTTNTFKGDRDGNISEQFRSHNDRYKSRYILQMPICSN